FRKRVHRIQASPDAAGSTPVCWSRPGGYCAFGQGEGSCRRCVCCKEAAAARRNRLDCAPTIAQPRQEPYYANRLGNRELDLCGFDGRLRLCGRLARQPHFLPQPFLGRGHRRHSVRGDFRLMELLPTPDSATAGHLRLYHACRLTFAPAAVSVSASSMSSPVGTEKS